MAKIRIGFSTHFEIENELAGIGTDNPTNTKQVLGNIKSSDAKVIGITTLTTPFEGFADTKLSLQGSAGAKQHTTSGEIIIEGDVTVSSGTTFTSGPENLTVTDDFTLPGISDDKPTVGTTRFNENLGALEFYTGSEWRAVNSYIDMGSRGRGIHAGGATPVPANSYTGFISAFEMATLGDAIDFGDLLKPGQGHAGCSSATRGLFGGRKTPSGNPDDDIEYLTIASEGQTIFFGNMSSGRRLGAAFSSSTRGIWACGITPSRVNVIDYVEISTLGDSIDFGDAMDITATMCGCSSPTRGIFCSGRNTSPATLWRSRVEEVTMASKGNSTKFGDLTVAPAAGASFSNSIRGFFAGGHTNPNYDAIDPGPIDYMTLATGGNAVRFGDLPSERTSTTGCASQTRGFVMGGYGVESPVFTNAIDYITIASAGNSMDFGDLVRPLESGGALSDSHGGLGGY